MLPLEEIRRAALALPPADRASLAHTLIDSLDNHIDFMDDEEFTSEIHRRAEEVESGKVQMIEWRQCMEQIRKDSVLVSVPSHPLTRPRIPGETCR